MDEHEANKIKTADAVNENEREYNKAMIKKRKKSIRKIGMIELKPFPA